MPSFSGEEIDFEVYCTCGEGLCNQSTTEESFRGRRRRITIKPCQRCIETASSEGYDEGYEQGYDKGERVASDAHAMDIRMRMQEDY